MCERDCSHDVVLTKAISYAFPPLGFYWQYGPSLEFGASIPLTLLGWIPGVIYAVVMFDNVVTVVEKPGDELVVVSSHGVSDGTRIINADMDETGDLCFQQEYPGENQRDFVVSEELQLSEGTKSENGTKEDSNM